MFWKGLAVLVCFHFVNLLLKVVSKGKKDMRSKRLIEDIKRFKK